MNKELFSLAMNEIGDSYIEEAMAYQKPVKYRSIKAALRGALAACLAAVLCFGTAFAVSAEFREAVYGWIKEKYITFVHYEYHDSKDNDKDDGVVRYSLTEVPSGYTEMENIFDEEIGQNIVVYSNEDEGRLFFAVASKGGNAYVESEGCMVRRVEIAGTQGELYISEDPAEDNTIVWTKDDMFFYISGFFEPDELIYYAERFEPVS